MMTKMRENMPLIMWTLVGAFLATIIFSWGMGGFKGSGQLDGVVAKIGNREILFDQFNRMRQEGIAREKQNQENKEAQVTEAQIRQVTKQVRDDLVRSELMASYQEKWGIVTSDQEVAIAVRNSPPDWIRQHESFQMDGKFDMARYEEFLRDPRSAEILVSIEKEYRATIGNQKVIDRVIAPVFITPDEVWDEFVATNQKFNAAVVSFPVAGYKVDTSAVTAEEVKAYYESNRALYEKPERRRAQYVVLPITATLEDTNRIWEQAGEVLTRLKQGEDFAELAKDFSEDEGTAVRGGDLGYFTRGQMVTEFDSASFATPPGEVTGPIATRFGLHVIKVVDRKTQGDADSVRASHVLIKWKVSPDTDERTGQKAKDLLDAAKQEGLEKAAARFGLTIQETEPFYKNASGNIPGFGSLTPGMDFVFANKRGALSNVYRTRVKAQDSYAILQVKEITPAGPSPLADEEPMIRSQLLQKKQVALAAEAARGFRNRVSTAASFWDQAERSGLKVDTTGERGQRDGLKGIGTDEQIARTLMAMRPGDVSDVLSNNRGAFVCLLLSNVPADSALFQAQKKDIEDRLRRNKQNNVYADWLARAEKEVGVEDKRYLYYSDY